MHNDLIILYCQESLQEISLGVLFRMGNQQGGKGEGNGGVM
jgi:hypothetical protein